MILEKIGKKNHRIWSSYEGEIPHTSFNPGLKEERRTMHGLLRVHEFPSVYINFPVSFSTTDKEKCISLCVWLFPCECFRNQQEKVNFPVGC